MFVFRFESSITHVDDPLAPSHQLEDGTVVIGDNIMHSCYQIGRVCHAFRRAMVALNPEQNAWDKSEIPLLPKLFAIAGITNQSTQTEPSEPKLTKSLSELPRLTAAGAGDRRAAFTSPTSMLSAGSRVAVTVSAVAGGVGGDAPGMGGAASCSVTCTARPRAVPITTPSVVATSTHAFVAEAIEIGIEAHTAAVEAPHPNDERSAVVTLETQTVLLGAVSGAVSADAAIPPAELGASSPPALPFSVSLMSPSFV